MSNHVLRRVAIAPIRIYQQVISPLLPDACIYYPTCSQYAIQAIEKYGVLRGCWLAVRRIARCNPLHVGGYDPVPLAGTRYRRKTYMWDWIVNILFELLKLIQTLRSTGACPSSSWWSSSVCC